MNTPGSVLLKSEVEIIALVAEKMNKEHSELNDKTIDAAIMEDNMAIYIGITKRDLTDEGILTGKVICHKMLPRMR